MESWNLFVDVCILHLLEEKGEFTNINVCLSVNHQFRDHEDQKLVSSGVALVYCFQNSFMKGFCNR